MSDYDFHQLDDKEFEEITRDLLQKEYGIFLESFSKGRDRGIDLRYNHPDGVWILQCKHYLKTSYSTFISELRKKEKSKVIQINPKKYILVTSLALTPQNKDEIKAIFEPYIDSTEYIIGRDDLNNLIGRHPDIEKSYLKLWIHNTVLLERILHSGIYNISDSEKIKIDLLKYVDNPSLERALEFLNKSHFCIISGNPGIGKTYLAKRVIVHYLNMGYELVVISKDIIEAREILVRKNKKFIFYYDDFLGDTMFKVINKNEDARLISFIEDVISKDNLKFVLTTREYILNQAKLEYEQINRPRIDLIKCTITLEDYTKLIRAKILYNHILYSNLNSEFKKELLKDNRYLNIINHKNFNPRIIDFMLSDIRLKTITVESYFSSFIENLNKPMFIWETAFISHIKIESRYFLLLFYSMQNTPSLKCIEFAFDSFKNFLAKTCGESLKYERNVTLKELEGSFIKIQKIRDEDYLSFYDPSVKDYIQKYISDNKNIIKQLVVSSVYFNQVVVIFELVSKLEDNNVENISLIYDKMVELFNKSNYPNYCMKLKIMVECLNVIHKYNIMDNQRIIFFNNNLLSIYDDFNNSDTSEIYELLNTLSSSNIIFESIDHFTKIVKKYLIERSIDNDSFANVSKLVKNYSDTFDEIEIVQIKQKFSEYLVDNADPLRFHSEDDCYFFSYELKEIAENLDMDISMYTDPLDEREAELMQLKQENEMFEDSSGDDYKTKTTSTIEEEDSEISKMFSKLEKLL